MLRAAGPDISEDALEEFDDTVAVALRRILAGDVPPASRLQASLATSQGGAGLTTAIEFASAAFVAARVESSPLVRFLLEGLASVVGGMVC